MNITKAEICFLGSLRDCMRELGRNVTEADLLGIYSGLNFRFGFNNNSEWLENGEEKYIWVDCINPIYDFDGFVNICKLYGIQLEEKKNLDMDILMDYLKFGLVSGKKFIINVDCAYLDYYPASLRNHVSHTVVLADINQKGGTAYIYDNYIPTVNRNVYEGNISLVNLMKALDLKQTMEPSDNCIWCIETIGEQDSALLNKIKKESLCSSAKSFLEPEEDKPYYKGIKGMYALKSKLLEVRNSNNMKERLTLMEGIYSQILTLGGPVASRKLYAIYIKDILEKLNSDYGSELKSKYEEISEQWKKISIVLLKAIRSGDLKVLDRGIAYLDKVISKEKECAEVLTKLDFDNKKI